MFHCNNWKMMPKDPFIYDAFHVLGSVFLRQGQREKATPSLMIMQSLKWLRFHKRRMHEPLVLQNMDHLQVLIIPEDRLPTGSGIMYPNLKHLESSAFDEEERFACPSLNSLTISEHPHGFGPKLADIRVRNLKKFVMKRPANMNGWHAFLIRNAFTLREVEVTTSVPTNTAGLPVYPKLESLSCQY